MSLILSLKLNSVLAMVVSLSTTFMSVVSDSDTELLFLSSTWSSSGFDFLDCVTSTTLSPNYTVNET